MQLKNLVGSRTRENPSHVKFRTHLDAAISSVALGARADPTALEGMLALVRSKEISPGDALSCFKIHFREGTPDEQFNTLRVLAQFVDAEPHLANMLHMELASRRWRERFVNLAASPHPEVRPLLVATLQAWVASYRAHDVGMHYQSTLREFMLPGGSFRPAGPGYMAQQQRTGYSAQTTGPGYPMPMPGYPVPAPSGYPPSPPGYPPYGPPYPAHSMQRIASRRKPETVPQTLEQLSSEVELLRGAIRHFETTLADYKAQRCDFSALSVAMAKGQTSADRCTALQSQMESLLGSSDADEGLMARVFTTNDAVVAAVEQWGRLANQELAPDDAPTTTAAASTAAAAAAAGPSTSAAPGASAAPPPVRPPPPPPPMDLLLGDELPSPTPGPPAAAASAAAAATPTYPFASAAAAGGGGSTVGGFPPQPRSAAPGAEGGVGGLPAAGPSAGNAALFTTPVVAAAAAPVVPASDIEGLRAQVLALASELEKARKMHKTALDAQEAFHKQDMAQAKAQAQARIAELESALALARQASLPPMASAGASGQLGAIGPAVGTPLPTGLSPNNPFAASISTTPSYISMPPPPSIAGGGGGGTSGSAFAPATAAAPPPLAPAPLGAAPAPAAQADFFNAFEDLAVLPSKPAAPAPSASSAAPSGQPPAFAAAAAAGGGSRADAAGPWVNFGY